MVVIFICVYVIYIDIDYICKKIINMYKGKKCIIRNEYCIYINYINVRVFIFKGGVEIERLLFLDMRFLCFYFGCI